MTDPIRADFRNFLALVWRHLRLPDPTPLQYDMAYYLQHGPDRRCIQAFRGAAKSFETAAYALWELLRNPHINIVVVSASKTRSDDFTSFMLRLIDEMPTLAHLKPREGQRRSMVGFDVGPAKASQTQSVVSVGVNGQMTGKRADILIADDVEVANNSETQLMREKLAEKIKEFDALIKPGGKIIYLGTPQTEDSIYTLLPARGYDVRIWPILYPEEKQLAAYEGKLAPMLAERLKDDPNLTGTSTEPTRFTMLDIESRRLSYGPAGFALQFMLDPRLTDVDRYPLKLSDLMFHPLDHEMGPEKLIWSGSPENAIIDAPCVGMRGDRQHNAILLPDTRFTKYQGVVMAIDPAGRGDDETAYAVVAQLHGMLFVFDIGGLKGYGQDTLDELAGIAKMFKVNKVICEPNFGDGMFTTLLKQTMLRIYPCSVEDSERSKGQKEKRIIDSLWPVVSTHKVVMNRSLLQKDFDSTHGQGVENAMIRRFFYQFTRLTPEKGALKHDDRIEALGLAIWYWTRSMGMDQQKAIEATRRAAREHELRDFRNHVFGVKSTNSRRWVQMR